MWKDVLRLYTNTMPFYITAEHSQILVFEGFLEPIPCWYWRTTVSLSSSFYFISVPLNLNVLLVYSLLLDYLISILFVLIDHLHGFLLIFKFFYGIFFFFLIVCVSRMLNFVTYVQIFFPDLYLSLNFNFLNGGIFIEIIHHKLDPKWNAEDKF